MSVGDDVSVFRRLEKEGRTSVEVAIEVWACARTGEVPYKGTEGVSRYVAVDEDGRPAAVSD